MEVINEDILQVNDLTKKINSIREHGLKDLVIISDFDFTITHRFKDGQPFYHSSFGTVEKYPKFDKEFTDYLIKNCEYYHPKEYDLSLSLEVRRQFMHEWTEKSLNAVLTQKVKKDTFSEIADYYYSIGELKMRKDAEKMFIFADEHNIPFYVLSAGSGDVIAPFLKKVLGETYESLNKKKLLTIVSNHFIFNEEGFATDYVKPILNTFNKVDALTTAFSHKSRNALVFGDHHHDSLCVERLDLAQTISVAFVNYKKHLMETSKKETLERYIQHWDVLIFDEGTFEYGYNILKSIKD